MVNELISLLALTTMGIPIRALNIKTSRRSGRDRRKQRQQRCQKRDEQSVSNIVTNKSSSGRAVVVV